MRTRTVCGVSQGDLPLRLTWLKDGDNLLPSMGVNISNLDQYTSILSITSLSQVHSGNYTCVASNQADEVKFKAMLQVKGNVINMPETKKKHPALPLYIYLYLLSLSICHYLLPYLYIEFFASIRVLVKSIYIFLSIHILLIKCCPLHIFPPLKKQLLNVDKSQWVCG